MTRKKTSNHATSEKKSKVLNEELIDITEEVKKVRAQIKSFMMFRQLKR